MKYLDAALLGLGPSGGMLSTEILATLLSQNGLKTAFNLKKICQAARWFARPAMHHLPRVRAVDLALAQHKLDYYPTEMLEILASILEIDFHSMFTALSESRPGLLRLRENDIRGFLASHHLDFEVVMEYIKTGQVPQVQETETAQ